MNTPLTSSRDVESLFEIAETLDRTDLVRLLASSMQDMLSDGVDAVEIHVSCTEIRLHLGIRAEDLRRALH